MANGTVIKGGFVSPEIKAEFDSLRSIFDAKSAMDRLESYSKWLFGSAAVVASLGAGLSNAAFSKLRGPGIWCFAAAIGAFTICLVAAAGSVAPKWVKANIYDLNQLRQAVDTQFEARRRFLKVAAAFFALALALAGLSPLVSLAARAVLIVHFSLDESGKLDAGLEATGLKPGSVALLQFEGTTTAQGSLPSAASTADDNGHVQLTVKMANTASLTGKPELVGCLKKGPAETTCFKERRLRLPK